MSAIEIIPTVVPASRDEVATTLARYRGFARAIHVDAADGSLAPNTTWIPSAAEALPEPDAVMYEAHLMVANPESLGAAFAAAGAKRIVAHVEAFASADLAAQVFAKWRDAGAEEIGVAVEIETPLEAIEEYVDLCECVTLMTISRIGTQGAPFDERGGGRVADVHARYPDLCIAVDGGVGEVEIAALARAGARRFCVGSAIAQAEDPAAAYQKLQSLAESAVQ